MALAIEKEGLTEAFISVLCVYMHTKTVIYETLHAALLQLQFIGANLPFTYWAAGDWKF
jgi:hypothetical protein